MINSSRSQSYATPNREPIVDVVDDDRPLADEELLVPFFVNGKAVGTIWGSTYNEHRNVRP